MQLLLRTSRSEMESVLLLVSSGKNLQVHVRMFSERRV